jgi:hypothetical protein
MTTRLLSSTNSCRKLNVNFSSTKKPKATSTDNDKEDSSMPDRLLRPGRTRKKDPMSQAKVKSKSSPGLVAMAAAALRDRRTNRNANDGQEAPQPPPPTVSPSKKPSRFVWNNKEHFLSDWDSDHDEDYDDDEEKGNFLRMDSPKIEGPYKV